MAWLNEAFRGKFPIAWSLAIIAAIIGASVAISLLRDPDQRSQTRVPVDSGEPRSGQVDVRA